MAASWIQPRRRARRPDPAVDRPYRLPRTVIPSRYDLTPAPRPRRRPPSPARAPPSLDGRRRRPTPSCSTPSSWRSTRPWVVVGRHPSRGHAIDAGRGHRAAPPAPRRRPRRRARPPLDPAFRGMLNDKLRGFYRSTFTDDDGDERVIATTQFEATDARRAFPCWDEPDFKAVFAVTLVVPDGPARRRPTPPRSARQQLRRRQRVRVRFADTMVMSTYLVAFVVGPARGHRPGRRRRHRRCGSCYPPGKGHLTALRASRSAAFCLRYFADYYGIALPGRQDGPRRRPRLRLRGHGEPRLRHLPRGRCCWSTRRRPPSPSCRTSPT